MDERGAPQARRIAAEMPAAAGPLALYRLQAGEVSLEFITLGATITRLEVPDRQGRRANVVLGHARLADYGQGREYFGATVGRLANRLRDALLRLEGRVHPLTANDGVHHLHGGIAGFDRRPWRVLALEVRDGRARASLERISPEGEEGYPGNLQARVDYAVGADGVIEIGLSAVTDRTTVANLTNHSYFNLRGEGDGDVLRHELTISADRFCVVDADLLPTGELRLVQQTAFDFQAAKPIGRDIVAPDAQLQLAGGYDHCLVLGVGLDTLPVAPRQSSPLRLACELYEPESGRHLAVWTDQPGVQLYSGNFLDGGVIGSGGRAYGRHAGLCLETQCLPDAPNHPHFPPVVLHPGQTYVARTVWRFSR